MNNKSALQKVILIVAFLLLIAGMLLPVGHGLRSEPFRSGPAKIASCFKVEESYRALSWTYRLATRLSEECSLAHSTSFKSLQGLWNLLPGSDPSSEKFQLNTGMLGLILPILVLLNYFGMYRGKVPMRQPLYFWMSWGVLCIIPTLVILGTTSLGPKMPYISIGGLWVIFLLVLAGGVRHIPKLPKLSLKVVSVAGVALFFVVCGLFSFVVIGGIRFDQAYMSDAISRGTLFPTIGLMPLGLLLLLYCKRARSKMVS